MTEHVFIARHYWADSDMPQYSSVYVFRSFDGALSLVRQDWAEFLEEHRLDAEDYPDLPAPSPPDWPAFDPERTAYEIAFDAEHVWFIEKQRVED